LKLTSALLLLSTIGLVAWAVLGQHRPPANYSTSVASTQNPNATVQAELLTITSTGFEPTELTRSNGRFLLAIDNRSGLDDIQLYFERETGGPVNVPLSHRSKLAWRDIIDLQPGTYLLRARNDDSWRCRITITR